MALAADASACSRAQPVNGTETHFGAHTLDERNGYAASVKVAFISYQMRFNAYSGALGQIDRGPHSILTMAGYEAPEAMVALAA